MSEDFLKINSSHLKLTQIDAAVNGNGNGILVVSALGVEILQWIMRSLYHSNVKVVHLSFSG